MATLKPARDNFIMVKTGLDRLLTETKFQNLCEGRLAYLCHAPSVTGSLDSGVLALKELFGERLAKLFGPQHGFVGDVQDNMVETEDYVHPYFNLVIHSLYSETRVPTDKMLDGIDTIIVDLQDVGTRIYTYIYTMTLLMKKCAELGKRVVVLDRPNPINGIDIEGNILEKGFRSFVGLHPLPVRHGMTILEIAKMANDLWQNPCDLQLVPMLNWEREMSFEDTKLPWVIPSPNLPTIEAAYTFVGTVLYEGTNISEGRGTTRSLEVLGHPSLEPFAAHKEIEKACNLAGLSGFKLRPMIFLPTFQKHKDKACGGYQIHVTDRRTFRPWRLSQILLRELYHRLGAEFKWKEPPYEYEYDHVPVDLINGTDKLRAWVETNGINSYLDELEAQSMPEFLRQRKSYLCY